MNSVRNLIDSSSQNKDRDEADTDEIGNNPITTNAAKALEMISQNVDSSEPLPGK